MAAGVASTAGAVAAAAVSTPFVLDSLGAAAFGVWTVLGSFVVYLGIAESGFGPAVQRFVAISRGREARHEAAALMWTMLAGYAVVGGGLCAGLWLLAPEIVGVFDFPAALREDSVELLELVALAVPVTLVASGLANVLFGLERFVIAAGSAALGALVGLVAVVIALERGAGLPGLGMALIVQQAAVILVRALALRDIVTAGPPRLAPRAQVLALGSFSAKLQLSALSVLVNGQSDKVVAGLVAPAATVGRLGVASQLAEAGRMVAGTLLGPVVSRLSVLAGRGEGERERLEADYRRLSRLWIVTMTGATFVGIGLLHPLLLAWLGDGYGEAVLFGAVLVLAYGINVITGIGSSYVRAVGLVGIEARSGMLMIGLNVLFTIPLALVAGALGVVLGTLAANVLGTAWFFWRLQRVTPLRAPSPFAVARVLVLATAAGAIALGGGWLAAAFLPRFVAIVPVALIAGGAFAAYAALALETPLRALFSVPSEDAGSARTAERTTQV